MFVLFSLCFTLTSAVPVSLSPMTVAPPGMTCSDKIIKLGAVPWNLPLTSVAGSQSCTYQFAVPQNRFAIVDFYGTGFGQKDQMEISDDWGDFLFRSTETTFMNKGAWPSSFKIKIKTDTITILQVRVNITLTPLAPLANVAPAQMISVGQPAIFQYFDNWMSGMSYEYKSSSGMVAIFPTALSGNISMDSEFKNVFVYEKGTFIGTLFNILASQSNRTYYDILMYAAMKPMVKGAVMVTHATNVNMLSHYQTVIVPYNNPMMMKKVSLWSDMGMDGAFTIIGAMDGSTPIDVTNLQIYSVTIPKFSVMVGGPMADHSSAMVFTNSSLPRHLSGNAWTFYISNGSGQITISISNVMMRK